MGEVGDWALSALHSCRESVQGLRALEPVELEKAAPHQHPIIPNSRSMPNTVLKSFAVKLVRALAAIVHWNYKKALSRPGLAFCPLSVAAALFNFMVANVFKVSRHEAVKTFWKRADLDWCTCHRRDNNVLARLDKKGTTFSALGDAICVRENFASQPFPRTTTPSTSNCSN